MFNLFIMHSSPYLCVYGDDQMIRYPGADDLTGEPGDAWDQGARWYGAFWRFKVFDVFMFWNISRFGFYEL